MAHSSRLGGREGRAGTIQEEGKKRLASMYSKLGELSMGGSGGGGVETCKLGRVLVDSFYK